MHTANERMRFFLRWWEYGYVVMLLFALTQGPVLSLWYASSREVEKEILPAHLATFIAVQIPALVLLGYRKIPRASIMGPVGLLGLFCGWMWLSTAWSTFGQHTIVESTTLCITFLTGVYIARSFSLLEQLVLVVVAMQPGLLLSRYAIVHHWSNAISQDGYWTGIYLNRNSLAPVAAVSILSASALLWIVIMRRGETWPITKIAVLLDIVLFGGLMMIGSKSDTPVGGAAVFAAVWAFWTVIRSLLRRGRVSSVVMHRYVYPMFIVGASVFTWAIIRFQSAVLGLFGETIDFNGRSEIWHYSWTGFLDRPIAGWGWMSAWHTPTFLHRDLWWSFTNSGWSHSAYMDVLLGGGVVSAIMFVGVVVWSGYQQVVHVFEDTASQWTPSIMFFVLAVSSQESFFVGNHFLWVLFVAAVAGSRCRFRTPQPES